MSVCRGLLWPRTPSLVLILDGFDELSLAFDKETVLKEIENLSKTTQKYKKVILTSRTQFFRSEEEEKEILARKEFHERGPRPLICPRFERIYVSLFDDEQIRQYLDLCLGKEASEKFWNETKVYFHIIFYSVLVYLFHRTESLLDGRVTR